MENMLSNILKRIVISLIPAFQAIAGTPEVEIGRRIYQDGILSDGHPIKGVRENAPSVEGGDAACATCHRRSGLGSFEGGVFVAPIHKNFLFHHAGENPIVVVNPNHPMGITLPHEPYDRASLDKALRQGVLPDEKLLAPLMPRYNFDKRDFEALYKYLETLSSKMSPGIDKDGIHFSAVFAPDVDDKKVDLIEREINLFVYQHNSQNSHSKRHHPLGFDRLPRAHRNWVFHFWRLKGPKSDWSRQLSDFYRKQPVFAIVGGASEGGAEPVSDYCERYQVPCIFQNDKVTDHSHRHWVLKYSEGVSHEIGLFRAYISRDGRYRSGRIIQLTSSTAAAKFAQSKLTALSRREKTSVFEMPALSTSDFLKQLQGLKLTREDAIVCWCEPNDFKFVTSLKELDGISVFASSLLLGDDRELMYSPPDFKGDGPYYLYPFEAPGTRERQQANFYSWITSGRFQAEDEMWQSQIYLTLIILQESLSQMVDNLYREYLLEKVESSIGMGYSYWGPYHRPALGPSRRVASRSGYVLQLEGGRLKPMGQVLEAVDD